MRRSTVRFCQAAPEFLRFSVFLISFYCFLIAPSRLSLYPTIAALHVSTYAQGARMGCGYILRISMVVSQILPLLTCFNERIWRLCHVTCKKFLQRNECRWIVEDRIGRSAFCWGYRGLSKIGSACVAHIAKCRFTFATNHPIVS